MGETDGVRGKGESYVELDEPGAEPVTGSGRYDASSEPTAAVDLDELEPVDDTPAWEEGVGKTEHLDLDDLEDAAGGWNDQPLKTEAVELEDLEVLEKLDPKLSNAPPALPDVGERAHIPHAPLPARRKGPTPKPKAAAKPRSAPPPPPKPPTRKESLAQAPKPMIGSEGWVAEDRISVVDFSAVLSAPPPPRKGEPTEKIIVGAPLQAPLPAAPAEAGGSGVMKGLLILLLIAGVGAGAYFLGRQGTPVVDANDPGAVGDEPETPEDEALEDEALDDEALDDEALDDEALDDEALDDEADDEHDDDPREPESSEPRPREAVPTAMRDEPRETTASAMTATMAAEPTEDTEPEPTMEPEPTVEPEPTMVAAMAPPSNLPDHPSREQVQAALDAIRPQVAACLEGQHATVRVRITVRNSGRVTTAVVQDSFYARPPIGSCIARTVRQARFPEFSEESFVVLYPFQL